MGTDAYHLDGDHGDDQTWQALEQLVLDMRRRAGRRNGRLHHALKTSLGGLAADAAALAADGGLGGPSAETPAVETPAAEAVAASTRAAEEPLAQTPAEVSAPAAETPPEDLTPAVEAPAPPVEAPAESPLPADTSEAAMEPAPVAEAQPAPTPPAELANAVSAWRVGASRTNPVPPATTETRPPWVPAYVDAPPAPGLTPGPLAPTPPPPSPTAGVDGTEPGGQAGSDPAALRDKPRPQALGADPVWSPEEWDDPDPSAPASTPAWIVSAGATVVVLISAVVTYLLVRG